MATICFSTNIYFLDFGLSFACPEIMANYPRSALIYDGAVFHVTWQCHNQDFLLKTKFAKQIYYDLLLKYKKLYLLKIFSYCLMGNHIHLTGQCDTQKLLSDFFRTVNSCFSKTLNKQLHRKGQTVMDRFQSPVMETENELVKVIVYNDLNPARTKDKIHPDDFKWSSYHHYAHGTPDALLDEPECYLSLGKTPEERQGMYRDLVLEILDNDPRSQGCPYRHHENQRMMCYVGDPIWVTEHFMHLQEARRHKRLLWQEKHKKFLQKNPVPPNLADEFNKASQNQ